MRVATTMAMKVLLMTFTLHGESNLVQVMLRVTYVVGGDELQRHVAIRRMPHVT
jgi:hypothetical protein